MYMQIAALFEIVRVEKLQLVEGVNEIIRNFKCAVQTLILMIFVLAWNGLL